MGFKGEDKWGNPTDDVAGMLKLQSSRPLCDLPDSTTIAKGDGPCVILMMGARGEGKRITYPHSELALRHEAGVEDETDSPREAYAARPHWQPERPGEWWLLPWG